MCDCYEAKCAKKGCPVNIPIHISDFCLDRRTFKAYCPEHVPKVKGAVILTCVKKCKDCDCTQDIVKEGSSFAIVYKSNVKFPVPCCHDRHDYGDGKKRRCLHSKREAVSINDASDWKVRIIR